MRKTEANYKINLSLTLDKDKLYDFGVFEDKILYLKNKSFCGCDLILTKGSKFEDCEFIDCQFVSEKKGAKFVNCKFYNLEIKTIEHRLEFKNCKFDKIFIWNNLIKDKLNIDLSDFWEAEILPLGFRKKATYDFFMINITERENKIEIEKSRILFKSEFINEVMNMWNFVEILSLPEKN